MRGALGDEALLPLEGPVRLLVERVLLEQVMVLLLLRHLSAPGRGAALQRLPVVDHGGRGELVLPESAPRGILRALGALPPALAGALRLAMPPRAQGDRHAAGSEA